MIDHNWSNQVCLNMASLSDKALLVKEGRILDQIPEHETDHVEHHLSEVTV